MSKVVTLNELLDIQPTNKETDPRLILTEDEVKSFEPFAMVNPEELQTIIDTIQGLALITYELYCNDSRRKDISSAA